MPETPEALGPTQRRLLWLIDQGQTIADMAEDLGVAESTVKGRLRKIKRLFPGTPQAKLPDAARAAGVDF